MSFISDHRMEGDWKFPAGLLWDGDVRAIPMSPERYRPGCTCDCCENFRREPNLLSEWADFQARVNIPAPRLYLVAGELKAGWVQQARERL